MTITISTLTLIISIGTILTLIATTIAFVKTKGCFIGIEDKVFNAAMVFLVGAVATTVPSIIYHSHLLKQQHEIAQAEQQKIDEKEAQELEEEHQKQQEYVQRQFDSMPKQWQSLHEYLAETNNTVVTRKLTVEKFLQQKPPMLTLNQYEVFMSQYGSRSGWLYEKTKMYVITDNLLVDNKITQ